MSTAGPAGEDPRSHVVDELALASAGARPSVARQAAALPVALVALGVALLGFGAFMWMNGQRAAREETPITAAPAPRAMGQIAAAAPEPQALPQAPPPAPVYNFPAPQFTVSNTSPTPPPLSAQPIGLGGPTGDPTQRRHAPALVVDLSPTGVEAATAGAAAPTTAATVAAAAVKAGADAAQNDVSTEEKFAERVGGAGGADKVRATTMHNLDVTIPQGAVIPGVLETALDSDLPGFARAVVSRDVRGFDGTAVLIPRGSRLIGQYKSGLALGQSRVFVIWTRVIRPDGVSIQIGSPGTDELGRGGLTGEINRHFFNRFGGSILLSVINAGVNALANNRPSAQVVIGSTSDATTIAAGALTKDQEQPPTVKTPQGSPIRIFVAKDLDFSGVAAVKLAAVEPAARSAGR